MRAMPQLVAPLWNDDAHVVRAAPGADGARGVAPVARDRVRMLRQVREQRDPLGALVDLPGRDAEAEHHARTVAHDVQLATPATPGTPQGVIVGLAPADAPARVPRFFSARPSPR